VRAALERFADRMARVAPSPWMFPALLAFAGTATVVISLVFNPAPDEHVELWGHAWPGLCGFLMATGMPCPQCGMTRAWIAMARGHWLTAFAYNPAGATLWVWLVVAGLLGWYRLLSRRYAALEMPQWLLVGWLGIWMIGLYGGGWLLRCAFDVNHLSYPQGVEEQLHRRFNR
jgi:hypothetical protein